MRNLKIVCILFCLLSLASALTGIRAIYWSTSGGLDITKQTGVAATLWSLFVALLFAGAAYDIHRRVPVVWELGWAVLIISSLEFMVGGIGRHSSRGNCYHSLLGRMVEPTKRLLHSVGPARTLGGGGSDET